MENLKELLDSIPCGLIGSIDGYDLWKYEANEGNLDSDRFYHLDLDIGDVFYNIEDGCQVSPFKDIDTLNHLHDRVQIRLDLILKP